MTGCNLLLYFPNIAISSHCFVVVRHFQVLQVQRPSNLTLRWEAGVRLILAYHRLRGSAALL